MPSYELQSGLPSYPAALKDKDAALVLPLYRAIAVLTQQVSAATGNVIYSTGEQASADQFSKVISQRMNKMFVKATVAIAFGEMVNLHIVAGVVEAQLADSDPGVLLPAHGVCDVPAGLAAGAWGEVILMNGRSAGIAGTVFGSRYFLGPAGTIQLAVPAAPGAMIQILGVGLGSAGFFLQIVPGGA